MRSRYTAFVKTEVDYIFETTHPDQQQGYNREGIRSWSKNSDWMGLEILETTDGGPEDKTGMVEFIARYRKNGQRQEHHEIAEFVKKDDRWYFKDGHPPKRTGTIRKGPKVGRNDPCTCGSGKKYKKCCGT